MRSAFVLCLFGTFWSVSGAFAQGGAPTLDVPFALDRYVSGQAEPSQKIVIYDVSYPVRAKLGEAVVSRNGRFTVSIKVPLQQGNLVVVEDSFKQASAPVPVQGARPGPLR